MVTQTKKLERKSRAPKRTQARSMRHDAKYCETLLWNELRDRRLDGFKFKRQHLIGRYIVDFVCLERHLIVEADGGIHRLKSGEDAVRDEALRADGYRVFHIKNEDVSGNMTAVLLAIGHAL